MKVSHDRSRTAKEVYLHALKNSLEVARLWAQVNKSTERHPQDSNDDMTKNETKDQEPQPESAG